MQWEDADAFPTIFGKNSVIVFAVLAATALRPRGIKYRPDHKSRALFAADAIAGDDGEEWPGCFLQALRNCGPRKGVSGAAVPEAPVFCAGQDQFLPSIFLP
ncbi:hypothetical protein [Beijerinckia mobilis]|uniref:hypothetical protein n=1 Tax=Beijerinckia mobilis TaxID=231434 RepID=UPI0012EB6984|nr:hypothetical protein [Beijerinckia mobilis]